MTDTTAAPEDRFAIGDHGVSGCYVVDRVLARRVSPSGLTWAAAHCEAQRLNRKARAELNKPAAEPAAPSCDCARKDRVIDHYRVFAAQVSRSCRDTETQEHALRTIKEASEMMRQTDV